MAHFFKKTNLDIGLYVNQNIDFGVAQKLKQMLIKKCRINKQTQTSEIHLSMMAAKKSTLRSPRN